MGVSHSYTVILIVGLIREEPPQQPIPPTEKEKTARIGPHEADGSVGAEEVQGNPENVKVVKGHPIESSIECPHIIP